MPVASKDVAYTRFTLQEANRITSGIFQLIYCKLVTQHAKDLDNYTNFERGFEHERVCTCVRPDTLSGLEQDDTPSVAPDGELFSSLAGGARRKFCFSFLCVRGTLFNVIRDLPYGIESIMRKQQGVIAQTAKQVYAKTLSMVGHVTTAQDRKHGSLDVINLILPCRNDLTHIQAELTYLLGGLEQDTYDFMRPSEKGEIGVDNVLDLDIMAEPEKTLHTFTRFTTTFLKNDMPVYPKRSQDLEAFNARHKVKKPVFDPVWPSSVAEDFGALRYGKDAVGLAQMTAQRREAAGGMRPSYLTDVFAMLDDFRINNINKGLKAYMDKMKDVNSRSHRGGEFSSTSSSSNNSDQEKSPKRQLKLISVTKDGKTSCTAVRNAAKSNSSASTSGISSKSNTATDSGSSSSGEREEINGTDKQVNGMSNSTKLPKVDIGRELENELQRQLLEFEEERVQARSKWVNDPTRLANPDQVYTLAVDRPLLEKHREEELMSGYKNFAMIQLLYNVIFHYKKPVTGSVTDGWSGHRQG